MIFYRTPDGQWHGTQADAGKDRVQIDVPTDKPNLLAFLNEHCRGLVPNEETVEALQEEDLEVFPDVPALMEDLNRPKPSLAQRVCETIEELGALGDSGFIEVEQYQNLTGVGAAFSRGVHILNVIAAGEHQLARVLMKSRRKKFGE